MGGFSVIIIAILWFILSTTVLFEYGPYAKDLRGLDLLVFFLVVIIGGPVFGINNILVQILDLLLPEGWNDDGPDDFYKGH